MRDNGNQSLLNICSFKDSVNINPEKFARECDSRPSPTSLCLVLGVRACTCVCACLCFVLFSPRSALHPAHICSAESP